LFYLLLVLFNLLIPCTNYWYTEYNKHSSLRSIDVILSYYLKVKCFFCFIL